MGDTKGEGVCGGRGHINLKKKCQFNPFAHSPFLLLNNVNIYIINLTNSLTRQDARNNGFPRVSSRALLCAGGGH